MSTIPAEVSERLAVVSRDARARILVGEMHAHAHLQPGRTADDAQADSVRFAAAKQVILRRLSESIDKCDLVAAEENLRLALTLTARINGCEQAKVQLQQTA